MGSVRGGDRNLSSHQHPRARTGKAMRRKTEWMMSLEDGDNDLL
jgi:hypothetical protein